MAAPDGRFLARSDRRREVLVQPLQGRDVHLAPALRRVPGRDRLQGSAYLIDIEDLLGTSLADLHAPGAAAEQAILFQPEQRLSNRRAAYPQVGSQRRFGDGHTRTKTGRQNIRAKRLVDGFRTGTFHSHIFVPANVLFHPILWAPDQVVAARRRIGP